MIYGYENIFTQIQNLGKKNNNTQQNVKRMENFDIFAILYYLGMSF